MSTTDAIGGNDLLTFVSLDKGAARMISALALALACAVAAYQSLGLWTTVAATLVGITIPAAWWFTSTMASVALIGFGGMLAGGCAVGAGVTGASVFAMTAWGTLFAIWLSAGVTDWLVDRQDQPLPLPTEPTLKTAE